MNKSEIARTIGVTNKVLYNAFDKAAAKDHTLTTKSDFNLLECLQIISEIKDSDLMKEFLKENFIEHIDDGYNIKGTTNFIKRLNENPDLKCCNTCEACIGKARPNSSILKPFCTVYNRYLENFNANVYEDWCGSWLKSKNDKVKKWLKDNAPTNIDIYGETDTVNGIKRSEFKSGEDTKQNEPIKIIGHIGFD